MNLKHQITQLKQQILGIMQDRHNALPDMNARLNDQFLHTLNRALSLLSDAAIQAEHPLVTRTNIAHFDSSDYSHTQRGLGFLCGREPEMNDRVTPGEGVPDCPTCLALLEAEAEKKMKRRGA